MVKETLMSEKENYEDNEFISFEEYEALSEEEKAEYEIIQLDEISTKTLARAAHAASDPETFGKYHDPQKFADYAKKTKSAKAAANVQRAASGMGHFAKPNRSFGYDPLKDAKTTRVTKSGTMNKQDAAAKKNEIKNRLGTHTKAKLPEEYDYELDQEEALDENDLFENWSKGTSRSYITDRMAAKDSLNKANQYLKRSKSAEKTNPSFSKDNMINYHKEMAKFHKSGYHGQHPEAETSMEAAKKEVKRHKAAAAAIKSSMNEEALDESVASETLKAGSRTVADPKSKIEAITSVIGAMHAMRKDDLTKWYTQAMDLIGKEADSLPSGANADSNSSSIDTKLGKGPKTRDPMPKLSVKEDVEEMFDGQDLSEEFKDRATILFEAAVNAKIIVELAKLEEQYEERLHEEVAEISEALEKKLDTYLDYVTETWLKENEVAIESTLRNEITEEFIDGLRGLFAEHYIEVPEDKIDVIEELAAKVEALETKLDESITENVQLREALTVSEMTDILREMAEDLTLNESEKFAALAEGIEFDGDLDTYRKKLAYVKESYFNKKTVQRVSNIEEETFEAPESDRVVSTDPEISRYAQAISRTVKR